MFPVVWHNPYSHIADRNWRDTIERATFHTYQYGTFEWVFVYRYVSAPIFRRGSIIFAWNRITKFSRFPPTIFRICKWIWIRVRQPLWDRRNICGRHAQIEAVPVHKPQFANCFSNSRQSAPVPAIGNLLSREYTTPIFYLLFQQLKSI